MRCAFSITLSACNKNFVSILAEGKWACWDPADAEETASLTKKISQVPEKLGKAAMRTVILITVFLSKEGLDKSDRYDKKEVAVPKKAPLRSCAKRSQTSQASPTVSRSNTPTATLTRIRRV